MNKLTPLLLSVLLLGVVACENNVARTTGAAPASTETPVAPPDTEKAQEIQADATSDVRRAQANADIRAREQRNNVTGGDTKRTDGDLQSEVRSKLEVNLPAAKLVVNAKDGLVTVSGTVPTQQQLAKIEPLAKEIKGVNTVNVTAVVAPAVPENSNQSNQ